METEVKEFDGVPLIVPKINGGFRFPQSTFENFEAYCGAGKGLGNIMVPETIYGLKVSPACFIHDKMFEWSEPSWKAFHYSNNVFHLNIRNIIRYRSANWFMRSIRYYRAVTYFNAVDGPGAYCFWGTKVAQGQIDKVPEFEVV